MNARAPSLRWAVLVVALGLVAGVHGQEARGPRGPRAGYLFPAGGRAGTNVEVRVGGQGLEGAHSVRVSGEGVRAEVVGHKKPMPGGEFQKIQDLYEAARKQLREAAAAGTPAAGGVDELVQRMGVTDEQMEAFEEMRAMRRDPKRQTNPQLAEALILRLDIAPGAKPGPRELRVHSRAGLSNPLVFEVGTTGEWRETELASGVQEITQPLPVVINGQVLPGDVDRFRFRARAGDTLVAAVAARDLIPYLADAVPGWFQATLTLRDDAGREVALADDFRFRPDPALQFRIPRDGVYEVEVRDALYRGREDFVYRLWLGRVAYLTGVYPLGGPAGRPLRLALEGWQMETREAVLQAGAVPGIVAVPLACNRGERVLVAFDTVPEAHESEGADQTVAAPCVMNGRIDRVGDVDAFSVRAVPGTVLVAEVQARRLGSPLDSLVVVSGPGGGVLGSNDDHEDRTDGLNTHHADSWVRVTVPSNGMCRVEIRDAQGKGGPAYAYRLRLGPVRADVAVRVAPSAVNVGPGGIAPVTLHAMRLGGHTGSVQVVLVDAPPGFSLEGGEIPAGQRSVRATLSVPTDAVPGVQPLRLAARSGGTNGPAVAVVPADEQVQAFFNRHLVPAREFAVCVTGARSTNAAPVRLAARRSMLAQVRPDPDGVVRLMPGRTVTVHFRVPPWPRRDEMHLSLDEPPAGIRMDDVRWGATGLDVELCADAGKAVPGLSGNLIFGVTAERAAAGKEAKPKGAARNRWPVGFLPAVPFTVAAPEPPVTASK